MRLDKQILAHRMLGETNRLELRSGQADVWTAGIAETISLGPVSYYKQVLTADELEQAERFHFEKDRNRYLVTRALVRCVLSRYGFLQPEAWRFGATAFGRPFVVSDDPVVQGLSFNLSHSDNTVVMGVTRGAEIGIDVEDLKRDVPLQIAASNFSVNEVRQLKALPSDQQPLRFLEIWTLKESYIKARGKGLSIPLGQFGFDLEAGDRLTAYFANELNPQQMLWRFWQWQPRSGSIAALCVEDAPGMSWRVKAHRIIPFFLEEETPIVMERAS